MISRYKFLYGVWRQASSQVFLRSRSIRPAERVSFYSSNIDPTLPTGETPLKAVTHNEFIPAEGEIDFLEKSIEAAKTTDQILNVIERHAAIMDHDHLLGCIKKLADLPQGGIFSESLADSDAFQTALDTIAHRVELFDGEELVELILCLIKLQVPSKAPVIEEICSELRSKLNDRSLTLGRLPQLIQILGKVCRSRETPMHMKQSSTPSVKNLIRTLHVAIQFRIRQELDVEDKDTCTRFFEHILMYETDKETVDFIAEATLRHCHSFSYHTAATVLYMSNFYLDRSPKAFLQSSKVKEILTVCLKIASKNMDSMSDIQLKRTANGVTGWRIGTDEFFATIWRKASNWSSEDLQNLLKGSLLNDFMRLPVANRIVARYLNQHDEFASLRIKEGDLCAMATAIATSAVHTAPGSDENQQALKAARLLMDFVVERGNFFQGDSMMLLANFLTQMCICGIYSWPHLDKVFESKSQERNSSSYAYLATLNFLEEMLAYKLKDSSKYACIPENSILLLTTISWRFSRTSIKSIGNCISSFANCSNGEFIKILVEVSGLKIDFVVAFGRDGIPLRIPGLLRRLVSLEELPPESKVVAIVFDSNARFSSGLTVPACEWKMKRLRDEGFCPVVLPRVPADGPAEANLAEMIQKALREGPVYRKHETSGNVIKKFRK